MKDSKQQLGDRVDRAMAQALKAIARILKVPKQQLTEDAIAMWMGNADQMAQSRRDMAMKAFKSGKVKKPPTACMELDAFTAALA